MLKPELDGDELFDSAAFEAKVHEFSMSKAKYVSIDLSSWDYIYSDSINKFISISRQLLSVSGRLVIAAPHQKVFEILCKTGTDKQIKIVRNLDELQMLSDILAGEKTVEIKPTKPIIENPKPIDDFLDLKQILSDTLNIENDSPSESPQTVETKTDDSFFEDKIIKEPELPNYEEIIIQNSDIENNIPKEKEQESPNYEEIIIQNSDIENNISKEKEQELPNYEEIIIQNSDIENNIPKEQEFSKDKEVLTQNLDKQNNEFIQTEEKPLEVSSAAPEKDRQADSTENVSNETTVEKPKKFIFVGQSPPPDLIDQYYEEPNPTISYTKRSRKKSALPKVILIFLIFSGAFSFVFINKDSIEDSVKNLISKITEEAEDFSPVITEIEKVDEEEIENSEQAAIQNQNTAASYVPKTEKPAQNTANSVKKPAASTAQKAPSKSTQPANKTAQPASSDIVEIYTFPAGALVYVNGEYHGKTPVNVKNLPHGNFSFRAELQNFEPHVWNVKYSGGNRKLTKNLDRKVEQQQQRAAQPQQQQTQQQAVQQPQTAQQQTTAQSQTAQQQQQTRQQTQSQQQVVQQTQTAQQQRQTVEPAQSAVVQQAAAETKPEPEEAIVSFSSSPPGADIFEDGVFVGKANGTPIKTTVGNHTYEFKKDDKVGTWSGRLRDGRNNSQLVRLQ